MIVFLNKHLGLHVINVASYRRGVEVTKSNGLTVLLDRAIVSALWVISSTPGRQMSHASTR